MNPSLKLDLPDPEWLTLLKAERAKGTSIAEIARRADMKRPSVSMLLSGRYPAQSLDLVGRKHGAKIVRNFRGAQLCPHLRRSITRDECLDHASAPMSASNIERMRQSEACRRCPHNPLTTERSP